MANILFDAEYYLDNNPDVAQSSYFADNPWEHYVQYGAEEAFTGAAVRAPNAWFDVNYYLNQYPDLQANGITAATALDHFLNYGMEEGRDPNANVAAAEADAKDNFGDNADAWAQYAANNADLQDAFGIDAGGDDAITASDLSDSQLQSLRLHYYQYGWDEDRPSPNFLAQDFTDGDAGSGDNNDGGNNTGPGETFHLTEDEDIVEGTDGNDTIVGDAATSMTGRTVSTLSTGDNIDGNGGNDTLNADVYSAAGFGGEAAVSASTTSVENVNLTANGGLGGEADTVYVDAKDMDGVEHLNSVYSRADLEVLNVQAGEDSMAPSSMHIGMNHTGSRDSHWSASDMTVLFDQDDLTSSQEQDGYYFQLMNQQSYDQTDGKAPVADFPLASLQFTVKQNGETQEYTLKTNVADTESIKTQQQLVDLLNQKLENTDLDGAQFTVDGPFTDPEGERTSQQIVLTVEEGKVTQGQFQLDTTKPAGNIYYNQGDLGVVTTPVETNVELTKVGASGDGGGLTIGSMNKGDASNSIHSGANTVNNTVAGLQTFNVTVHGPNALSSSLAYLQSTNNVLETVNIDSEGGAKGNWADLYIGNSNTGADVGADFGFGSSEANAQALKDVATLDASDFNGDLSVFAGLTNEFGSKYDLFNTSNNDGDVSAAELNQFDPAADSQEVAYTGGSGDDTFHIAISDEVAAASHLVDGGVSLAVNGGKGNDVIDIDAGDLEDDDSTTAPDENGGVWTLNGGAGNDTFNLSDNGGNSTIVFNQGTGKMANGHDTINDFSTQAVQGASVTAEVQTLDFSGVSLGKNDSLTLNIDGHDLTLTANNALQGNALASAIAGGSLDTNGWSNFSSNYDLTVSNGVLTVTQQGGAEHNIGTITAEGGSEVVVGETTANGVSEMELAGNDVLDFSSYNLEGLTINGANTAVVGDLTGNSDDGSNTFIDLVLTADGSGNTDTYDVEFHSDMNSNNGNVVTVGTLTFQDNDPAQGILHDADASNFLIA